MDKIKSALASCALAASLVAPASQAFLGGDFFINPYVAAEAAYRHFPWEGAYGERHFREQFSNANFMFGVQFHDYFAVEGGYQSTDRRDKTEHYFGAAAVAQEPVLGFLNNPGNEDASTHISQAEVKGWHLNLIGLWPILPQTTLYASVGAAWMRFYVNTVPVFANAPANLVSHWHSDRDTVFRFGLGVKQFITDNFGARLFFTYENTSGLEGVTTGTGFGIGNPPTLPSHYYTAKSRNSYLFGLGFFYQLCPNRK